jgi:hypothetical protein
VTSTASSLGTTATSAVQTITVALKGIILHDPAAPGTSPSPMWMQFNDTGADEEFSVEAALVQYQGRTYPVVEYGASESRVVSISKATLLTDAEEDQLLALVRLKRILCYRDVKGRKVYGVLSAFTEKDRGFGYEMAFSITQVDSSGIVDAGLV